jgi:hypothetical protein
LKMGCRRGIRGTGIMKKIALAMVGHPGRKNDEEEE